MLSFPAPSACCTRIRRAILITGNQLLGITRGLDYLHSNGVIHGNLKGVGETFSRFFHRHNVDFSHPPLAEHPHWPGG